MKKIILIFSLLALVSCSTNESTNSQNNLPQITFPQLNTNSISNVTPTSIVSGGNITTNGGSNITVSGVIWSTAQNPNISLTTKTSDGSGGGNFVSNISGLLPNTTYYVRAYATNIKGVSYGNELKFTTDLYAFTQGSIIKDIDGNQYPTIITNCSNQVWFQKNLNVSHYKNGDVIPQVTDPTAWANLTTGAWCYYNNDPITGAIYGKLYNWYAVNDPRGLAPEGWHIPSTSEWQNFAQCLRGTDSAGGGMREQGNAHWNVAYDQYGVKQNNRNQSGFTALAGGTRYHYGAFDKILYSGLWCSLETTPNVVASCSINYDESSLSISSKGGIKNYGYSVRCLKN